MILQHFIYCNQIPSSHDCRRIISVDHRFYTIFHSHNYITKFYFIYIYIYDLYFFIDDCVNIIEQSYSGEQCLNKMYYYYFIIIIITIINNYYYYLNHCSRCISIHVGAVVCELQDCG